MSACCIISLIVYYWEIVARDSGLSSEYNMLYKIEFEGAIGEHKIYKDWRVPGLLILICKSESWTETLIYDKYALGVYKRGKDKEKLVRHEPIDLSQLLNSFLTTDALGIQTL